MLTHAQQRAEKHMHVSIGYFEETEILMQILHRRGAVIEKSADAKGQEIWQVYYMNKVFRVVFDPEVLHSIITVKVPPRRKEIVPEMLTLVRKSRKYFRDME